MLYRRLRVLLGAWLAGAGGLVALHAATERLHVVTTILPVYCIAAAVGGDKVEVRSLVGSGGDAHDYQLTPRDRSELGRAQLLLMNGLGVEPWLKKAVAAAPSSLRVIDLSRGLERQLIPIEHGHGHAGEEGGHAHGHGEKNAHVWLDPSLMAHMVTNALQGLQAADVVHAEYYASNAMAFVRRLDALDAELAQGLRALKDVPFVTFHDAFPYFARRYGLKVVGVVEEIPEVDPTPRHLSALSERIRVERARAIFVEPRHPRRLADRLGRDLGVKVGVLDTLETGPLTAGAYEAGLRGIMHSLQSTLR